LQGVAGAGMSCFGVHYKGEDTDWNNVSNRINITAQIGLKLLKRALLSLMKNTLYFQAVQKTLLSMEKASSYLLASGRAKEIDGKIIV